MKALLCLLVLVCDVMVTLSSFAEYRGGYFQFQYDAIKGDYNFYVVLVRPGSNHDYTAVVDQDAVFDFKSYTNSTDLQVLNSAYKTKDVAYDTYVRDPWVAAGLISAYIYKPPSIDKFKNFGFLIQGKQTWNTVKPANESIYLFMKVYLNPRTDDPTIYNSSPGAGVVAHYHHFSEGCIYTIDVPMYDYDYDYARCRLASTLEEGMFYAHEPGVLVIEKNCIIKVNTTGLTNGTYPVSLVIEDFLTDTSTTPLGSIPIQFLFSVFSEPNPSCYRPIIPDSFIEEESKNYCTTKRAVATKRQVLRRTPEQSKGTIKLLASSLVSDPVVRFVAVHEGAPIYNALINSSSYENLPALASGYLYFSANVTYDKKAHFFGETTFCFIAVTLSGLSSEQKCVYQVLEETPGGAALDVISVEIKNSSRAFYEFKLTMKAAYFTVDEKLADVFQIKNTTTNETLYSFAVSSMTVSVNLTERTARFNLKEAVILNSTEDYTLTYPERLMLSQSKCIGNNEGSENFTPGKNIPTMSISPVYPPANSIQSDVLNTFVLRINNEKPIQPTTDLAKFFSIKTMLNGMAKTVYTVNLKTCTGATCTLSGSQLTIKLPNSVSWINGTSYYVQYDSELYTSLADGKTSEGRSDNSWNYTIVFSKQSYRYYTECNDDSMSVYVNKSFTGIPTGGSFVASWNDVSCLATDDGTVLTFTAAYGSCSTQTSQDSTYVVYTNFATISNGKEDTANVKNHVVYAQHKIVCKKPMKVNITFTNAINVTEPNTIKVNHTTIGEFTMEMKLHKDEAFKTALTFPAVVSLGDPFNLALTVKSGGSNLSIIPQECYATPDVNMNNPIRQVIVSKRCPESDRNLKIIDSTFGNFKFTIDSFRFKNGNDMVYIHCQTIVCLDGVNDPQCQFGCPSRRRKRQLENEQTTGRVDSNTKGVSDLYTLRTGLIIITEDKTGDNQNTSQDGFFENTPNQILFALLLLTLLAIVIFLISRRYRKQTKSKVAATSPATVTENKNVA